MFQGLGAERAQSLASLSVVVAIGLCACSNGSRGGSGEGGVGGAAAGNGSGAAGGGAGSFAGAGAVAGAAVTGGSGGSSAGDSPGGSSTGGGAGAAGGDGAGLGGTAGDSSGGASGASAGGGNGGLGGAGRAGAAGAAGAIGGASGAGGALGPREPNVGPGGPKSTFTSDALFKSCTNVNGGDTDQDHHNMVGMYDGYMLMPWAHEAGRGGLSFFDVTNPCALTRVSSTTSDQMRESHTLAYSNIGGRFLITAQKNPANGAGGIMFWDISDVTAPRAGAILPIPGHNYPNAYDYVVLAVAPQGRYAYVAAGYLGIIIVDVGNPAAPTIVGSYVPTPQMRVMQAVPIGNLLVSSAAEGSRALLLDISNPTAPQPIPGGDFNVSATGSGATNSYSFNVTGGYAYFTRQSGTGGLVVYDIRNPRQPRLSGAFDDPGGNGGYVFFQGRHAFGGNSGFFSLYDISNPASIVRLGKFTLTGDMDTISPIGNVAVLSIDDAGQDGAASAIAPWAENPDTEAPTVSFSYPANGATALALSSRLGVTFTEALDPKSVWRPGSVRVYPTALGPGSSIAGNVGVLDTIVNFSPAAALAPRTEYTLEVVPGGVEDFCGNAVTQRYAASFTTGG